MSFVRHALAYASPCARCGASDRYKDGACRPCKRRDTVASLERRAGMPCVKCGRVPRVKNRTRCLTCFAARMREYRKNFAGKRSTARTKFQQHLRATYGLEVEDWARMYEAQDGRCPGCNCKLTFDAAQEDSAHVDHDHVTGAVRGLLCDPCNRTLGTVRDSLQTLLRLHAYLLRVHSK